MWEEEQSERDLQLYNVYLSKWESWRKRLICILLEREDGEAERQAKKTLKATFKVGWAHKPCASFYQRKKERGRKKEKSERPNYLKSNLKKKTQNLNLEILGPWVPFRIYKNMVRYFLRPKSFQYFPFVNGSTCLHFKCVFWNISLSTSVSQISTHVAAFVPNFSLCHTFVLAFFGFYWIATKTILWGIQQGESN